MWDSLAAGIQSALPEWAKYQGYGTYALAGYVYAAMMGVLSLILYAQGYTGALWFSAALGLLAWLYGSYYKGAAKVRVECDHCGERARGKNICPHCGEVTYKGGSE